MSTARMRQAAADALAGLGGEAAAPGEALRASVDVRVGDGSEMVSLRLGDTGLSWSCSCGQPGCAHARVALELLAGGVRRMGSSAPPPPASGPDVRVVQPTERAVSKDGEGLADALCDVVTAVARVGVESGEAAAVKDSLRPLFDVAPQPLPLGIVRWVGRLKLALSENDTAGLARVLHGGSQVAEDLRASNPDANARMRLTTVMGVLEEDAGGLDRISDRSLVEVAREWVDGLESSAIERRYLIDLHDGVLYREERLRGGPSASLGACPRSLHVGLAEVEPGTGPRRLHVLQYAASPEVSQSAWTLVGGWATQDWSELLSQYRDAVAAAPGLAEPFVLVAPAGIEVDVSTAVLHDPEGRELQLEGGPWPAALDYLDGLTSMRPAAWIAGRLVAREGLLCLRPISLACASEGRIVHAVL